ncbi:MAG: DUF4384 domain-containing protein [Gemmatimonadales bacterium]
MMLALLLSLAPALTQADDPPPPAVSVRLNHEQFARGDRARVYVETAQDGYLIVLHADPAGRVRVLFPLDPTDDAFARGGQRLELRGRSGRDAFFVDADDGAGTVLAAVAGDPFTYDGFVLNGHWDYRALGGPSLKDDPLAGLLDIVRRMAGETRFEYDAATYVVGPPRQIAARYGHGSGYGYGYGSPYRFRLGLSFGYPYRYGYVYDPFYDPFCYDPFWGWSARCYGYGYQYGYGFGFGYSFYRPRPFGYGRTFLGGGFAGGGGSRFVIPRDRGRYTPVEVRTRVRSDAPAPVRDRGAISRGVEPRPRGGSVNRPARSWGAKPNGNGVSRGRPSVSRGGSVSRGRPSVSRGGSGGSRPAARPSGGRRRP